LGILKRGKKYPPPPDSKILFLKFHKHRREFKKVKKFKREEGKNVITENQKKGKNSPV